MIARLESLSGAAVPVHAINLTDTDKPLHLFTHERIDAVIHFAGLKAVGESAEKPLEYYTNNLDSPFSLLEAMQRTGGVQRLVFSSSATVYGGHAPIPYREDYWPLSAASPYGRTKVMIEQVLTDVAAAGSDLKVALLRYSNPVGAHSSGDIGEDPQGIPNNLMPFIVQVAVGRREKAAGVQRRLPDRGRHVRARLHPPRTSLPVTSRPSSTSTRWPSRCAPSTWAAAGVYRDDEVVLATVGLKRSATGAIVLAAFQELTPPALASGEDPGCQPKCLAALQRDR